MVPANRTETGTPLPVLGAGAEISSSLFTWEEKTERAVREVAESSYILEYTSRKQTCGLDNIEVEDILLIWPK